MQIKKELEMKNYAIALNNKIQSRAEELSNGKSDLEKQEFSRLQDEVKALAELYRHYCELDTDITKIQSKMQKEIETIENIITSAKTQMISGTIDKQHLIEVMEMAKKNLIAICNMGEIRQYADLVLEGEKKEKDSEER